MASSKYAYVRNFELPDPLLPGTYMLFRLDGHSFHRFSEQHNFAKPNDLRALELMDRAARHVMEEFPDIQLAFGESDEYSFLLQKSTTLYNRREAKIVSTLTSAFTSAYVFHWPEYFPTTPLQYPPSFDGRIVLYPNEQTIRDYFAWRQADTHINNLYNTTFWALIQQGGKTTTEAHAALKGTFSKDKHEILFSQFGINYNTIDPRFRKGSVLFRELLPPPADDNVNQPQPTPNTASETHPSPPESTQSQDQLGTPTPTELHDTVDNTGSPSPSGEVGSKRNETRQDSEAKKKDKKAKKAAKAKLKLPLPTRIVLAHCDIIKDEFWNERPELLRD